MTSIASSITTYETIEGVLPAQVLDAENLPAVDTLYEGMTIAFHSRGRYRAAKVTKIGPKRVTAIYTTEGAHTDAIKIAGINRVAVVRGRQRHDLDLAVEYRAKADAIDAGQVDPDTKGSGAVLVFLKSEDERAEKIAEWRATYPTQLREWAESMETANDEDGETFKQRLAQAEAEDAVPFAQRVIEATNITSKTVKRDEVFAV
jgi:hypothetical protein